MNFNQYLNFNFGSTNVPAMPGQYLFIGSLLIFHTFIILNSIVNKCLNNIAMLCRVLPSYLKKNKMSRSCQYTYMCATSHVSE